MMICLMFYEERDACWIHFPTIGELELAASVLDTFSIAWVKDPDDESRNIKVRREWPVVKSILELWMQVIPWEQLPFDEVSSENVG